MRTTLCLITMFLFVAPSWAQESGKQTTPTPILTVEDVVRMVRSGENTISIVEKIQNGYLGAFPNPLSSAFTDQMKKGGVPQVVINELVQHWALYGDESSVPTGDLSNRDVRNMLAVGLSPSLVVEKIKNSRCDFDTSAAALAMLKRNAVPQSVLLAMVKAPSDTAKQAVANATDSNPAPQTAPRSQQSQDAIMTDDEYLGQFPACSDLVNLAKSSLMNLLATSPDSTEPLSADRIQFFADSVKRCSDDPGMKNSARGSDAIAADMAKIFLWLAKTVLEKQQTDYRQMVNQYNQLVDQYNANLAYVRSLANQLSLTQYFVNMFQRPQPTVIVQTAQPSFPSFDLNCHTSEDMGFGTDTTCN